MIRFTQKILTSILSFLPVKSVLRFRCLSKPRCSLIDSPEFVKLHLDQSISTETNICLVIDDLSSSGTTHFVDLDLDDNYLIELDRSSSLSSLDMVVEDSDDEEEAEGNLFATCNGLVALYNGLDGMILWNPSTDKQQLVPNFWGEVYNGDTILDGFGYDVVNDEYKLVRIRQSRWDPTGKAVVYSSKTRTTRTLPDCPYVYSAISAKRPGVYAAGSLNWVAFRGEDDHDDKEFEEEEEYEEDIIIGFDLTSETFHVVPQPEIDTIHSTTLGVLGGCLAVSCCFSMTFDLEIWVMKDYGVEASWTKLVYISRVEQEVLEYRGVCTRPLYLTRKGDRVLLEMQGRYLFWYNIALKRIEYFQVFYNVPGKFYSELMFRSLVSFT